MTDAPPPLQPPAPAENGRPTPGRAAWLLFLLFLVNLFNFFDRTLPGVVLEPISREFGLSDTLLGILGTAFVMVYAVAGVPLGRLADRYRRTTVLSAGVAVWSLLTAASGMVKDFTTLLLARLGVGVGEASCAPAANSLIADLYPADKRARALGVFMLGLPIGSLAAFALGGWIAAHYGWRMPFFVAAVPGLLLAGLLYVAREPRRGVQDGRAWSEVEAGAGAGIELAPSRPYHRLLGIPTLWWLVASGAACNFAAYALNTFLTPMLMRFHGLGIAKAGGISAVVLGVTGLFGLIIGGWLADAVHKRWPGGGRLWLGAGALLAAAALAWVGLSQPVGAVDRLTLFLSLSWTLVFVYYVTVYPAIHDVVPAPLRATGMAVFFLFMYVLGGGLGTTVTGYMSDVFARQAMQADAGAVATVAATVPPAFRALGLQQALAWAIPVSLLLCGLAIAGATRTFARDAGRGAA